jgi:hypothetical protein
VKSGEAKSGIYIIISKYNYGMLYFAIFRIFREGYYIIRGLDIGY